MKGRITMFEFSDVEQLRSEIECGNLAPDKRKGYCFQLSVALELMNPPISKLWKLITQKISELKVKMSPLSLTKFVEMIKFNDCYYLVTRSNSLLKIVKLFMIEFVWHKM